jgi:hypothetical protein
MRRAKIILVAALALFLAGCILKGKPKTIAPPPTAPPPAAPAQPPEPLSIPQTQEQLPPYQILKPDALKEADPPAQAKPAPAVLPPTKPKPPVGPTKPAETAPDPQAPEPRSPIREILPADVEKQFQDSAERHKLETRNLLATARKRGGLNANEKSTIDTINELLRQCDQFEKSRDMRSADEYAEKAYLLAKDLQNGK